MSNSNLIARMHGILDDYKAGHISPEHVERALEFHMQALEGIGLSPIHAVRTFTHRLVSAHMSDGEQEFKDDMEVDVVITSLRSFLLSLPAISTS